MIPSLRAEFNRSWSQPRYERLVALLAAKTRGPVLFPVAETPCFFPRTLMDDMVATGARLAAQLGGNAAAAAAAKAVVPERYRGGDEDAPPTFLQVDFGLVNEGGRLRPKLVELQAFASLYGMQEALGDAYREAFALPAPLKQHLQDLDRASYHSLVGSVILGGHDPAEVVLMEIDPPRQKTWPDFVITEAKWGVRAVDAATGVEREGRRLFYRRDGVRTRIRRIYNRVIPDELERKGIVLPFDYRDDLDVEWAGHPSWYFRISKFSIPFLDDPSVPKTWFLHELDRLPEPREHYLLKPLFSFAGGGIVFAPTDADVAAIPDRERRHYIVQERIAFAPVIDTPHGGTQVEVRVMYVWTAAGPQAVIPLLRMGRGRMMGVDHNKGLKWVGASAGFISEGSGLQVRVP